MTIDNKPLDTKPLDNKRVDNKRVDNKRVDNKKGKYQHRDAYLNAALDIIHEVGVDKLTMRKVAEHLDVSPMAIYKHFPRKEDLLIAALDEFIARAAVVPPSELPWQEWISYMAQRMYAALCREPNWLPWLGRMNIGPHALMVTTAFLQKLTTEGLSFQQALLDYMRLLHLLMGAANVETALKKTRADILHEIYAVNDKTEENPGIFLSNQLDISLPLLINHIAAEIDKR